jgi:hypothetical protein
LMAYADEAFITDRVTPSPPIETRGRAKINNTPHALAGQ